MYFSANTIIVNRKKVHIENYTDKAGKKHSERMFKNTQNEYKKIN